jgi:hypothetical protein
VRTDKVAGLRVKPIDNPVGPVILLETGLFFDPPRSDFQENAAAHVVFNRGKVS